MRKLLMIANFEVGGVLVSPFDFVLYFTIFTGLAWILSVLALYAGLGKVSQKKSNDKLLSVSVLIAARNEAENIGNLLEALAKQNYPGDKFEIIIIDDNSSDATVEIALEHSRKMHNLYVGPAGFRPLGLAPKKHALSVGIGKATGEIILATDADCVPQPEWISGMVKQFTPGVDAVAGYSPLQGAGFAGAVSRFDSFVNAVVSAGSIGLGFPVTAVGRNFAYRKKIWENIGGFDGASKGASGDDDLLLQKIDKRKGKTRFALDPQTFVKSKAKSSFNEWRRMKTRHISAGKRYRIGLIFFSAVLYLFQVGLIACFLFTLLGKIPLPALLAIVFAKVLADFAALYKGAGLLNERKWLAPFIIAELISPALFVFLVPSGLFGRVKWKDRVLRS